jgi:hypothetical protein
MRAHKSGGPGSNERREATFNCSQSVQPNRRPVQVVNPVYPVVPVNTASQCYEIEGLVLEQKGQRESSKQVAHQ